MGPPGRTPFSDERNKLEGAVCTLNRLNIPQKYAEEAAVLAKLKEMLEISSWCYKIRQTTK